MKVRENMGKKLILGIAVVIAGYAACRGIMETQETKQITPKSAHNAC